LIHSPILLIVILFLMSCASNKKRVEKNEQAFKTMADYVLTKYSDGKFTSYMIITMDTVTDERLKDFSEKFDIKNVYVYDEIKSQSRYMANTISFFKNYTPLVGKKTEIIVDYQSEEQRKVNPFPKGVIPVAENVYYARY
jgi:hypothetical protein